MGVLAEFGNGESAPISSPARESAGPFYPKVFGANRSFAKNQFSFAVCILKGIGNPAHVHLRVRDEDAGSTAIELIAVLLVVIHGELGIDIPLRVHVLS